VTKNQALKVLKKECGCWNCDNKDCVGHSCVSCQYFVSHDVLIEAIGVAIKLLEGEKDDD
jgi:hypothetical protein